MGSSGWWELTRGYLNTNSGVRRILLPDSGPLTAHDTVLQVPVTSPPSSCGRVAAHMHWSPGPSQQGLKINPCPGLAPGKHCHCRQAAVCCQAPEGHGYAGSRGPPWTRAVCHHFPRGSWGGIWARKGRGSCLQPWSSCFKALLVCIRQEVGTSIHNSPARQPP